MTEKSDRSAAVYRHINVMGETIYIGCSINPMSRFVNHNSVSSWPKEVARIDIEWFTSQEAALSEEKRLIAKERPRYNQQANPGNYKPRKPTTGHLYLADWMGRFNVSRPALSRATSIPLPQLKQLFVPCAYPRWRKAVLICAATGGYVPAHAWEVTRGSVYEPMTEASAAKEFKYAVGLLTLWGDIIPANLSAERAAA